MAGGVYAHVFGAAKVVAALAEIGVRSEEAGRLIVATVGAKVEKAAKANFEGSHGRRQPHVGGDKPNVVTGTLRRSIYMEPMSHGPDGYTTKVGPATVYARAIEWGNPHSHSRAFPYFIPAVESVRPEVAGIAARFYTAATRA